MKTIIEAHLSNMIRKYQGLHVVEQSFNAAITMLVNCYTQGRKILICGNGGSAADAEHIVGELMKAFLKPRPLDCVLLDKIRQQYPGDMLELSGLQRGIPAISLVSGVSLPTAFANDVVGDLCFAQQVLGLAKPGDVVWGISTSGNSRNVNLALKMARVLGCHTLGLTGKGGGEMASLVDVELRVPAENTPDVQELHLPVYHAICACLEAIVFAVPPRALSELQQSKEYTVKKSVAHPHGTVALIVFDFDGVFTNNLVLTAQDGTESVFCSRGDGLGIDMLRSAAVPALILSTETNPVVHSRAAKLKIPVFQGCKDKALFLQNYLWEHKINPQQVVYMGNDINDLAAMKIVGTVVAPADAHPDVLAVANYITSAKGGCGAVRELCDYLLQKK